MGKYFCFGMCICLRMAHDIVDVMVEQRRDCLKSQEGRSALNFVGTNSRDNLGPEIDSSRNAAVIFPLCARKTGR